MQLQREKQERGLQSSDIKKQTKWKNKRMIKKKEERKNRTANGSKAATLPGTKAVFHIQHNNNSNNNIIYIQIRTFWLPPSSRCVWYLFDSNPFLPLRTKNELKNHRVVMHETIEKKGPVVGFMTKRNRKKCENKILFLVLVDGPTFLCCRCVALTRNRRMFFFLNLFIFGK